MGIFNCPVVNARLTSKFGWRDIGRGKEWHQGVDLASPTAGLKVPVYASAGGEVVWAAPLSSYGNSVRIIHIVNGKTYETNYAHLDKITVKKGQRVKQGEQIGIMGNTGGSFGVHLHFEIHNGRYAPSQPNAIDPMKWIELITCKPLSNNSISTSPTKPSTNNKIGYKIDSNAKAFRIHTDAFKSKSAAQKAQKDFVTKGYLKYAEVFGNDKDGYRLQSGKYLSQKDAEAAGKKMLDIKVIGYASIIGSKS
ncbi:peptidoglycan DD-metalloendopeptidase family protein [Lysinibacillus sp. BPa_S21]|uniref:peptidoglycan DD-metalloendopeptidase family protein n=1 Tax=Lysinibacillus sp. BPa_S21 TaxID=2932478 RepID=UPI002011D4C4|nr:peptidoglycan DD-metalloendopeptidase family protein [Lysinibacillus sp. BPa_S21]MCL1696246.1 peptidoglycan DD-metalloendopeptidase family protein [Lysinibacillus sp. BPa_S21]